MTLTDIVNYQITSTTIILLRSNHSNMQGLTTDNAALPTSWGDCAIAFENEITNTPMMVSKYFILVYQSRNFLSKEIIINHHT